MSLYNDASLVMIPSAYKDGKLYSIKPTDGSGDFTFSRGSNLAATRVDENGLIEKGRENRLLQSNQFDTTWVTTNTSVTGGQSGYDGTNDAWLLNRTSTSGYIRQSVSSSNLQTISIYVKTGTLDWVALTTSAPNTSVWFDILNGTIGTTQSAVINANIQSVDNGYYRCSIVINASISAVDIYPAPSDASVSGSTGNIYIQDAQLEVGLVATDYIETTTTTAQAGILEDMPRLDYSGSCPSLLLEPQRTNLVTQSEYMGEWAQSTGDVTLSDNLSPEGVKNCYRLEGTASGLRIGIATFAAVIGNTYTGSIWVRKVSGSDTAQIVDVDFNQTQINITTEWQRFSITRTADSTIGRLYVYVEQIGDVIEIYGAQLEEGSYATSYIPTYGSAVTRNADAAYKTGVSSLIGQTEGTLFVEVDTAVLGEVFSGNSRRFLTISDGTTTNRINIYQSFSNDSISLTVTNAGATQALISSSANQSGIKKIAVGYANNDFVMYINGVEIGTDTSGSVPACNRVGVGSFETSANTANSACPVSQALLFKTRLSNEELAALTTI